MAKGIYVDSKTFKALPLNHNLTNEIASRSIVEGDFADYFNILPDPDPILRKLGLDVTVYKDLLSDDEVGSTVQRRKNGVKKLDYKIKKQGNVTDKEIELCSLSLENMTKNDGEEKIKTKDMISQSLDPILWGTGVFEVIWEMLPIGWLPRKVQIKPSNWFFYDNRNRIRLKRADNAEGELINQKKYRYKFIVLRNEPTYENPYGDKILSRCFWPVAFKRGGMKFFALFVEKYGMPHITGKQPRGAGETAANEFKNKLVNMIQDAVAVIPDDSSVEIHQNGTTASADIYERFIDLNNKAIDKAILTNTLSTEQKNKGGYSSSKTGTEIETELAMQDKEFTEELFNELFKMIIDINLGNGKYPKFEMFKDKGINSQLAERDKTLKDTGITFTKKYYETHYKLAPDEFEITSGGQPAQQQPPSQFSEAEKAIKTTAEKITAQLPDTLLQMQIEKTLKPVLTMIKEAADFEEVQKKLYEIYPKMDASGIEQMLQKLIFIADLEGVLKNEQ